MALYKLVTEIYIEVDLIDYIDEKLNKTTTIEKSIVTELASDEEINIAINIIKELIKLKIADYIIHQTMQGYFYELKDNDYYKVYHYCYEKAMNKNQTGFVEYSKLNNILKGENR